jgi:hypothetical protein
LETESTVYRAARNNSSQEVNTGKGPIGLTGPHYITTSLSEQMQPHGGGGSLRFGSKTNIVSPAAHYVE